MQIFDASFHPSSAAGDSAYRKNHAWVDGSQAMLPRSVAVLGVPFDRVTIAEAVEKIEEMIASQKPHYVVTANVDFLIQARKDVELRRILVAADLVLCDGAPIVWASRWLGSPLPERAAGSDVIPCLMRAAAEKNLRVFFLGAGPGVAAAAAQRLEAEYPTLKIDHFSPPFGKLADLDHGEMISRVRAASPDILLVSFGCPKQEKWISMHYGALGVPVSIGVGATLDFLAGRVNRAPAWMQHSGTEWIYRLMQEPRRLFRRYASDFLRFPPILLAEWWLTRRSVQRLWPQRYAPPVKQPEIKAVEKKP